MRVKSATHRDTRDKLVFMGVTDILYSPYSQFCGIARERAATGSAQSTIVFRLITIMHYA